MRAGRLLRALLAALLLAAGSPAGAQVVAPHAIDIPSWFVESFLDFREDVDEARREGKRVLLYIGQDGCPYCAKLMQVNFRQPDIVAYTQKHFVPIALNLWGDRETVWFDGMHRPEKELAAFLKVQFTPTLLFLDEQGRVVARLNGYYPPGRFMAALRYVAERMENRLTLAEYLRHESQNAGRTRLVDQPFFMKPPYDLRRKADGKPLAVLVETAPCQTCEDLHQKGFSHPEVRQELAKLDIVRFGIGDSVSITAPDGRDTTAAEWIESLHVTHTPTLLLFDRHGKEVLRVEAYVGPFHLASALAYLSSEAHLQEPSFQRYLQRRADERRARGERVILYE